MERNFKYLTLLIAACGFIISGCKKDFFNKPPESALTVDNFYQTTTQVQASTSALYSTPWFNWNNQISCPLLSYL